MEDYVKNEIKNNRRAIKEDWRELRSIKTDRQLNLERPEMFKQGKPGSMLIELKKEFPNIKQKTLSECIKSRRSLRSYKDQSLTFEELTYLLWETSRVDAYRPGVTFRTIPTAGATNSMETYVFLNKVEGIKQGLYLYVQDKHQLSLIDDSKDLKERVDEALYGQLRGAPVVFFFTATPYRTEYKYAHLSHKMIAIEAGHAGQNLSLAAEVIDCGAVALCAYVQEYCDRLLGIGEEEFVTYAITLGKR
ncbi:MAG: SagB/ThcOx family dehydrogenase [Acholeplasmataceae bacterium]|nr:SagB/ThcOx family dehydrogenase [Acholeplasmataceae bacterium]